MLWKRSVATTAMAVAMLASAGCSTYAASRYSIAPETVSALRTYRPQVVAVGPFTAVQPGLSEINCRAVGPIKTPDGESFEEFVRRALIAELTIAEIYATQAPLTLTGHLERVDFKSGVYFTDAAWQLALTVKSSNGKSLRAVEEHGFKTSYGAEAGCQNTAHAIQSERLPPR